MHFNTGSLDGDELVRQFIDVVTSYEMIGVKIYGIVSDGGGGSTNFSTWLQMINLYKENGLVRDVYVHSILLIPLGIYVYMVLFLAYSKGTKKHPVPKST